MAHLLLGRDLMRMDRASSMAMDTAILCRAAALHLRQQHLPFRRLFYFIAFVGGLDARFVWRQRHCDSRQPVCIVDGGCPCRQPFITKRVLLMMLVLVEIR
jgi:hypothetical protein